MGRAARADYESRYACDKNYAQLIAIYNQVLKRGEAPPAENLELATQTG